MVRSGELDAPGDGLGKEAVVRSNSTVEDQAEKSSVSSDVSEKDSSPPSSPLEELFVSLTQALAKVLESPQALIKSKPTAHRHLRMFR